MFHGLRTNNSCKEKFLAIKTDMSKAYDRLEWPFIEAMLLKLGFAQRWVSRIMSSITSVKYKILNMVNQKDILYQTEDFVKVIRYHLICLFCVLRH